MLAPSGSPATINVRCWAVPAAKPQRPATENQHRDVQRQDQQRQQQAAALEAHGQGRADAEQAQHRRTEQQESSSTVCNGPAGPASANSGDIRTRASRKTASVPAPWPAPEEPGGAAKGPTAPENRPRNRCGTALPARAARPIAPPPRPGRATRFVAIGFPARPPGEQGDDDGEEHQRVGQPAGRRNSRRASRARSRLKTLLMPDRPTPARPSRRWPP